MNFILVMCFGLTTQAQTFLENLMSQTVVHPMIEEQKQYLVTPAIGLGTYSNSLSIQNGDSLLHTNSNFYIFGLDINGYSSHLFIPYRDKSDRLARAVDSDVFQIQAGMKLTPELTIDGGYSKVIGFYHGSIDDMTIGIAKYPDLGFKKYSFVGTYMMNSAHKSSLFAPISYSAVETGSSGFFNMEINHFEISGLEPLNLRLAAVDQADDPVHSAKTLSMLGSAGWSQSKMYENFFWSYAIGVGFGATYVDKQYESRNAKDVLLTTTVPFGGAFGWHKNQFTTGLFASLRSWSVKLDQLSLSTSNGNTGYYFAYQF